MDAQTLALIESYTGGNRGVGAAAVKQHLQAAGLPEETARALALEYSGGGGAPGSPDFSPSQLAGLFKQPDVTLPDAAGAKTALRDLQLGGVSGLKTLMGQDPYAQRQALTDAMYGNAARKINYEGDRLGQDARERTNARNMLASTSTSYELDPIERARSNALENAANDAFVSANTLSNQNAASQASILGQAFNQGTTGLQGEANVEAANRNANQGATQAGYQTGLQLSENAANRSQQESQYSRSLAQQRDLQNLAFQNARDIAGSNQLAAGIGGGLSGLATLFGPSLNKWLTG